jgi:hypothetical protein
MDYQTLNTLIKTHPSWPSVSDGDLVTWVNAEAMTRAKATLPATTILQAILTYKAEWDALTDANRNTVRDVLYIASGEGVPTAVGNPIRTVLVNILGTQTKSALGAAIDETVSRGVYAGLSGPVHIGDIQNARVL